MIDKDDFELHRSIVNWLYSNGAATFSEALSIVSYSIQTDKSIPESFVDLSRGCIVEKVKNEKES